MQGVSGVRDSGLVSFCLIGLIFPNLACYGLHKQFNEFIWLQYDTILADSGMPHKSKMAAMGIQNARRGLKRIKLCFWRSHQLKNNDGNWQ